MIIAVVAVLFLVWFIYRGRIEKWLEKRGQEACAAGKHSFQFIEAWPVAFMVIRCSYKCRRCGATEVRTE